jgi:hypothetical protein
MEGQSQSPRRVTIMIMTTIMPITIMPITTMLRRRRQMERAERQRKALNPGMVQQ